MADRYRVKLTRTATRQLEKLAPAIQHRLVTAMTRLGGDPRPAGVSRVKGSDDVLRIRVGDYRILYSVVEAQVLVLVIRIGHRSEVYRAAALRGIPRRKR